MLATKIRNAVLGAIAVAVLAGIGLAVLAQNDGSGSGPGPRYFRQEGAKTIMQVDPGTGLDKVRDDEKRSNRIVLYVSWAGVKPSRITWIDGAGTHVTPIIPGRTDIEGWSMWGTSVPAAPGLVVSVSHQATVPDIARSWTRVDIVYMNKTVQTAHGSRGAPTTATFTIPA